MIFPKSPEQSIITIIHRLIITTCSIRACYDDKPVPLEIPPTGPVEHKTVLHHWHRVLRGFNQHPLGCERTDL